jgi:Xaa-Pro aminopeptidase
VPLAADVRPPPDLLAARHANVRAVMSDLGIATLLVTAIKNVQWLTGFAGSTAAALVRANRVVLVTDGRYEEEAAALAEGADELITPLIVAKTYEETLAAAMAGSPSPVGFEADVMPVSRHRWYVATFEAAGIPSTAFAATVGIVESCRVVKDPWEIGVLREAAARLSAVAAGVLADLRPGLREQDVAQSVEAGLRRAGFYGPAFDTIVASGPRGALPHGRATDRMIQPNEAVVLDFGGIYGGYCVDLTRTVACGEPGDEVRRWHSCVLAAQRAAIECAAPGVAPEAVDRAAREVLEAGGLLDRFTHGTGHGLGLEVHEAPRVGPARTVARVPVAGTAAMPELLQPGMVFTVEPGVYIPGRGGIRIEDDVLVTASGVEVLTSVPTTLVLD